jgi:hypothetical protein
MLPVLAPCLGRVPFSPFCADAARMLHAAQRSVAAAASEAQAKHNAQGAAASGSCAWLARGSASAKSRGAVRSSGQAPHAARLERSLGAKRGPRQVGGVTATRRGTLRCARSMQLAPPALPLSRTLLMRIASLGALRTRVLRASCSCRRSVDACGWQRRCSG